MVLCAEWDHTANHMWASPVQSALTRSLQTTARESLGERGKESKQSVHYSFRRDCGWTMQATACPKSNP